MFFERARAPVLGIAVAIALAVAISRDASRAETQKHVAEVHTPLQEHSEGYVSSAQCRSCHPNEYASWHESYHRSMTQLATPESVIGAFDDVVLRVDALEYRLEQRGARYFARDLGAGAASVPQPITLLTGSHYMQIYWYETGEGRRLGQLPFVYLKADRRWVPRNAIFIEPPHELHTGATGRWNASCIACHTTFGQPRIDSTGAFDTRVSEFGIACEACHGPAESHVEHNHSPLERYRRHLGDEHSRDIVQPEQLSHVRSSLVCGQCHGTWLHDGPRGMRRWNEHGFAYRPGGDPADTMLLMRPSVAASDVRVANVLASEPQLVEGQFWSDGEVRVSGREFNGMVDSACYARGELSCLSCHRMHQAGSDSRPVKAWADTQLSEAMDGDRACLQCHERLESGLTAHTHHAPASEGSRCYNCHMPFTSYGLLKSMRSHRISVPDVGASVDTGRPNACNLCHLDKSLGWTAHWLREFYGRASPVLDPDQQQVASALLLGLTGDAGQRALIAWALGWQPAQRASQLTSAKALLGILMDDPYDAVRYIAGRSLQQRSGQLPSYDWLQRPGQRAPIAAQVAGSQQPSAAESRTIERLRPLRNDRPLHLLE
jgi:hypothetical protein